jgi:hypothetical protein
MLSRTERVEVLLTKRQFDDTQAPLPESLKLYVGSQRVTPDPNPDGLESLGPFVPSLAITQGKAGSLRHGDTY